MLTPEALGFQDKHRLTLVARGLGFSPGHESRGVREAARLCTWAMLGDHRGSGHLKDFKSRIGTGAAAKVWDGFSCLLLLNQEALRGAPAALARAGGCG